MRLIDADYLKEHLMACAINGRPLHRMYAELDDLLIAIDDVPTIEPEPHWISCKERLPEEDGDYLVTFEEGYAEDYGLDLVGIAPYEVDCEGFGIWQEEFDIHTLGSLGSEWVDIHVIAWQPLPKRYREEGVEE